MASVARTAYGVKRSGMRWERSVRAGCVRRAGGSAVHTARDTTK